MSDPVTPASALARAMLGTLFRTGLKVAGTALVTRGLIDQGAVDGLLPALTEELVGAVMLGSASAWSIALAWWHQHRPGARPAPVPPKE